MPLRSRIIHGSVLALWIALLCMAFMRNSVFAWSVGLAYIGYDTLLLAFVFVQTLSLLKTSPPPPAGVRSTVSVVVAVYNEAEILPANIEALLKQSDPPDHIIIADDGSTDATSEILAGRYGIQVPAYGEISPPGSLYPSLRWLRLPHGGKARTLNSAISFVSTDVVLTVDGDTLLDREAIGAVRRAFSSDADLAAVTGVLIPVCSGSLAGKCFQFFQTYEYIRNFISRYAWMRKDSLLLVSGAFAGFRRDALVAAGGFDPDCLVEDYELIHRLHRYSALHRLPWRIRVLGEARALTHAPSSISAFLRQRRRWFGGFLQTHYWYRDMVGNAFYGSLGTRMLPVKAVDTLQPVYGLTAFILLIGFLATGRSSILIPVAAAMGVKIAIDLAFHVWSVHLYRRWVGNVTRVNFIRALVSAVAEPFTFQILRHLGAVWGWASILTGHWDAWGKQSRADAQAGLIHSRIIR